MNKFNNISKTKIKFNFRRKTSSALSEAIKLALENKNWLQIAKKLASSTRKQSKVNLGRIDAETKAGDTVLILGKVLSSGDITKKVRICSLGISKSAKDKLKPTKSEYAHIADEIKINPKAEGIRIIS